MLVLQVTPFMVTSFTAPTGVVAAIYVFAVLQIIGCYQIFCRPTFGFAYTCVIRYSPNLFGRLYIYPSEGSFTLVGDHNCT